MRLSVTAFAAFVATTTTVVQAGPVTVNSMRLPKVVVVRGEGTIADPGKWTPFPTPPPAVTASPTGYPTVPTEPPLPQNYILLDQGSASICPGGALVVELEDCLDAAELMAASKYGFPFYLDEHTNVDMFPCGCFIETTDMGSKIVAYNTCQETAIYDSLGLGMCDDGGNEPYYPSYYGHTSTREDCEIACTFMNDCIAYDYSEDAHDSCHVRFPNLGTRNVNTALPGLTKTYDGCGNSCNTDVLTATGAVAGATLYVDNNFRGHSVTYPAGNFDYPAFVGRGMPNDQLSSLKVMPGYKVALFQHGGFGGWKATFTAGEYNVGEIKQAGGQNDDASSMKVWAVSAPECFRKTEAIPESVANPATELICKLPNSVASGVDNLEQWNKVYGYGLDAGNSDPALWAPNTLTGEFYIMRTCQHCTDSHKTIIYKRLTPLPADFNVENLFINTWSSANNVLNVDFKLYNSMTFALADLMPWTYCSYDTPSVGFPGDCGPDGSVLYQWHNLVSGAGQQNFAYYVWNGNAASAVTAPGECVASNPSVCGCAVVNQLDYRGSVAETRIGHTCQAWDSQFPHSHEYTSTNNPDAGLAGTNACRNPNNWHEGAWCYTTDPNVRWSLCDVPDCYVPPFNNDWYKDYPFQPWHLPPWHLVMNINPSDLNNAGWGSSIWTGEADVGIDQEAIQADYKDYTVNWHRSFDCIAIVRHNTQTISGVKVWKMNATKTFSQHFNNNTNNAREVVTVGGPQYTYLEDGIFVDNDPILAGNGTTNNLAFNWRYGNSGSRIVLTDVGNFNGVLSCETCNDYSTHGLGNDFDADTVNGYSSTTLWHDASVLQGACSGAACRAQGTDHGTAMANYGRLGSYAIYVTMSYANGTCPIVEIDVDNGVPVTQEVV
eukprot:CAMPEP_0194201284 /NCGR_PEP_ID=MMETSP0156-20130528/1571_1 /TAXON_ID=33649 /ORGANISM="Thalassionema nitzschioides, Strain L26-B" /LENGTH=888 /DNA_ID=CAMNT_0038926421 /DNA_START=130 /DNA_END=2796 /DNA_ORIENTATION=+